MDFINGCTVCHGSGFGIDGRPCAAGCAQPQAKKLVGQEIVIALDQRVKELEAAVRYLMRRDAGAEREEK